MTNPRTTASATGFASVTGRPGRRAVGNYLEVDGKLYQVEIARDGACVSLRRPRTCPSPHPRCRQHHDPYRQRRKRLFHPQAEKGLVKLPVGEYRVNSWTIARKDDGGAKWEVKGDCRRAAGGFTVPRTRRNLPFGEPIYSMVQKTRAAPSTRSAEARGPPGGAGHADSQRSQPPPPSCTSGAGTEAMTAV